MTKNIFQNRLHFKSTKSNHVTSPHHETPGKKNKIFPNSFGGKARTSGPRTDDNDTSSSIRSSKGSIRSSKEEDSNGDDDISVKMEVQSSRVWDVKVSKSRKNISGFLPFTMKKKKKRLALEVLRPFSALGGVLNMEMEFGDKKIREESEPPELQKPNKDNSKIMMNLLSGKGVDSPIVSLMDDEEIVLRISKPLANNKRSKHMRKDRSDSSIASSVSSDDDSIGSIEDDELSMSTLGLGGADEPQDNTIWVEQSSFQIYEVELVSCFRNVTAVYVGLGDKRKYQQFLFDSEHESHSFFKAVRLFQVLAKERTERLSKKTNETELQILVEVCSAWNLQDFAFGGIGDWFCTVKCGKKVLHKTDAVQGIKPIWTIKSKGLFLLSIKSSEFFSCSSGLSFELFHKFRSGNSLSLGVMDVPHNTILNGPGGRMIFELKPANEQAHKNKPVIALKFRKASESDMSFMNSIGTSSTGTGMSYSSHHHQNQYYGSIPPVIVSPKKSNKRAVEYSSDGQKLLLVKPQPDPSRLSETTYMTKTQIEDEVMLPSQKWRKIGNGSHQAQIFLEVLKCDSLVYESTKDSSVSYDPLLSSSSGMNPFVTIVYEDGFVSTDVIHDKVSPVWLPWTNRAFKFLQTSGSPLSHMKLAVFHKDMDGNDNNDRPIGRINLNLQNFTPSTEYDLKYNLYNANREIAGKINIRLHIEITNVRKYVRNLICQKPSENVICVNEDRDLDILKYTTLFDSRNDKNCFMMKNIGVCIDELKMFQNIYLQWQTKFLDILCWRKTYQVDFLIFKQGYNIQLPIYSMVWFTCAVYLSVYPELYASFCAMTFVLFMSYSRFSRQYSENVWDRLISPGEILRSFLYGQVQGKSVRISPPLKDKLTENKSEETTTTLSSLHQVQGKSLRISPPLKAKLTENKSEETTTTLSSLHQEDNSAVLTSSRNSDRKTLSDNSILDNHSLSRNDFDDLLEELEPFITVIENISYSVRLLKSIFTWEESYHAFWSTFTGIVLCTFFLFVPWTTFLSYIFRVSSVILSGPWMYHIGKFMMMMKKKKSQSERRSSTQLTHESVKLRSNSFAEEFQQSRSDEEKSIFERENEVKLKDMKDFLFGHYTYKVDPYRFNFYRDIPLETSSACPVDKKKKDSIDVVEECSAEKESSSGGGVTVTTDFSTKMKETAKLHRGEDIVVDMVPQFVNNDTSGDESNNDRASFHLIDSEEDLRDFDPEETIEFPPNENLFTPLFMQNDIMLGKYGTIEEEEEEVV